MKVAWISSEKGGREGERRGGEGGGGKKKSLEKKIYIKWRVSTKKQRNQEINK